MKIYPGLMAVGAAILLASCGGAADDSSTQVTSETAPEALSLADRADGAPSLSIMEPADGAVVGTTFTVEVTTTNFTLEEAGVARDSAGHFHVHTTGECVPPGELISLTDDQLHVPSGASDLVVSLEPGTYDLCAQVSDGFHVALGITDIITVTVDDSVASQVEAVEGDSHDHDDH